MHYLPNEIFADITNFLPNDDITDLMLMSRNFKALVTPRLKKIDKEMRTLDQHIESLMPSPEPEENNDEWIPQLNLKRFEPIGYKAKKRMKDAFHNQNELLYCMRVDIKNLGKFLFYRLKAAMSLQRFDYSTFFRISCSLLATPKFRQEYNISLRMARRIIWLAIQCHESHFGPLNDVERIWSFYNPEYSKRK
ncbi:hypothetical protein Ddc_14781 [Ditylenchus destructor]|nr:hypothetical protein Ddc_14781 [Ditylenchus destructor]